MILLIIGVVIFLIIGLKGVKPFIIKLFVVGRNGSCTTLKGFCNNISSMRNASMIKFGITFLLVMIFVILLIVFGIHVGTASGKVSS